MQIKITEHWDEAHWTEYTLTLTPQQQQQVEAHRLANPEATDYELMNLLNIEYTYFKDNCKLVDEGYEANNNEHTVEIDDQASVEVVK
jgi:hypothetical protein